MHTHIWTDLHPLCSPSTLHSPRVSTAHSHLDWSAPSLLTPNPALPSHNGLICTLSAHPEPHTIPKHNSSLASHSSTLPPTDETPSPPLFTAIIRKFPSLSKPLSEAFPCSDNRTFPLLPWTPPPALSLGLVVTHGDAEAAPTS